MFRNYEEVFGVFQLSFEIIYFNTKEMFFGSTLTDHAHFLVTLFRHPVFHFICMFSAITFHHQLFFLIHHENFQLFEFVAKLLRSPGRIGLNRFCQLSGQKHKIWGFLDAPDIQAIVFCPES